MALLGEPTLRMREGVVSPGVTVLAPEESGVTGSENRQERGAERFLPQA